jgi:hypothetical protein
MHRQHVMGAQFGDPVEFVAPQRVHLFDGADGLGPGVAGEPEVRGVIEQPGHRHLHNTARVPIRPDVVHQVRRVFEAVLGQQRQRVRAEIP